MKLQVFIMVVLRLLAVHGLLLVVTILAPQVLGVLRISGMTSNFSSTYYLLLLGSLVGVAALWFLAMPIARLVTRGVSGEFSTGSLTLVDGYSLAFIATGLYYLIGNLAGVLSWAHYLLQSASSRQYGVENASTFYDAWQVVVTFLLGVFLFLNGRKFAVALVRKQQKVAGEPSQ